MSERFPSASKIWHQLGVPIKEHKNIEDALVEIEMLTDPISKRIQVSTNRTLKENINYLVEIEDKYELSKNANHTIKHTTRLKTPYELKNILTEERLVALIGMPGCGKSTILKIMNSQYNISVIDEYFDTFEDFEDKQTALRKILLKNKPLIIAAVQLDKHKPSSYLVYLKTNPEIRKHNIGSRIISEQTEDSESDKIRLNNFEAFNIHDEFLYGLQCIKADAIYDATHIRY